MDPARIHPDFALRDEIPSRCHPKSSAANQNPPNPFSWNSCWFLAPTGIPPGIPRVMNPSRAELLKILQIPLGMGSLIPGRCQNLGFSLSGIPGAPKSFPCFHGEQLEQGFYPAFIPQHPPERRESAPGNRYPGEKPSPRIPERSRNAGFQPKTAPQREIPA